VCCQSSATAAESVTHPHRALAVGVHVEGDLVQRKVGARATAEEHEAAPSSVSHEALYTLPKCWWRMRSHMLHKADPIASGIAPCKVSRSHGCHVKISLLSSPSSAWRDVQIVAIDILVELVEGHTRQGQVVG
jgi:hypothetical protein